MADIKLRRTKGSALTFAELDDNFNTIRTSINNITSIVEDSAVDSNGNLDVDFGPGITIGLANNTTGRNASITVARFADDGQGGFTTTDAPVLASVDITTASAGSASGSGSISYDPNTTQLTYTPPDISDLLSGTTIDLSTQSLSGTIPTARLPSISLTSIQTVADETAVANLSSSTQEGDVVIQTSGTKSYVRNSGTAGTIADFTELLTPDSDTTYSVSIEQTDGNDTDPTLNLTPNQGTADTVTIKGGGATTVSRTDSGESVTITSTNTTYDSKVSESSSSTVTVTDVTSDVVTTDGAHTLNNGDVVRVTDSGSSGLTTGEFTVSSTDQAGGQFTLVGVGTETTLTGVVFSKIVNNNPIVKLTGSDATVDSITLTGGTNVTVARNSDTQLTITSDQIGSANGVLKADGSGVVSAAVASTDYIGATSGSAIQKADGAGGLTGAVASTDYIGATSGSAIQKADGSGGLADAVAGTDYIGATSGSAIQKASSGGLTDAVEGTDFNSPNKVGARFRLPSGNNSVLGTQKHMKIATIDITGVGESYKASFVTNTTDYADNTTITETTYISIRQTDAFGNNPEIYLSTESSRKTGDLGVFCKTRKTSVTSPSNLSQVKLYVVLDSSGDVGLEGFVTSETVSDSTKVSATWVSSFAETDYLSFSEFGQQGGQGEIGDDLYLHTTRSERWDDLFSSTPGIVVTDGTSANPINIIGNGTGFLKNNGSGTYSYDNSTYLTGAPITVAQTGGTDADPAIKITPSSGSASTVTVVGGNNINVTRNSDTQLTIDTVASVYDLKTEKTPYYNVNPLASIVTGVSNNTVTLLVTVTGSIANGDIVRVTDSGSSGINTGEFTISNFTDNTNTFDLADNGGIGTASSSVSGVVIEPVNDANPAVKLAGDSETDKVTITGGTNIDVTRNTDNKITVSNSGTFEGNIGSNGITPTFAVHAYKNGSGQAIYAQSNGSIGGFLSQCTNNTSQGLQLDSFVTSLGSFTIGADSTNAYSGDNAINFCVGGTANAQAIMTLTGTGDSNKIYIGPGSGQGSGRLETGQVNIQGDLALENKLHIKGSGYDSDLTTTIEADNTNSSASWVYTDKTYDFSNEEEIPNAVWIGDSGTKMYIIGAGDDDINQYALSTAYDVSTASLTQTDASGYGGNPQGMWFSSNGTQLVTVDTGSDQARSFTLSTPWDISTRSSLVVARDFTTNVDENPTGVFFGDSGNKVFFVGSDGVNGDGDIIYSYDLSSAYDISTISTSTSGGNNANAPDAKVLFSSFNSVLPDPITLVNDLSFTPDGKTVHIVCKDRDGVVSFSLGTAWDISTMSYSGALNHYMRDTNVTGIYTDYENNIAVLVGQQNDTAYQFSVDNKALIVDSKSTQFKGKINAYDDAVIEGQLFVSGKFRSSGGAHFNAINTLGNVNLTGGGSVTYKIGGTDSTGTMNIGRSTESQTLNIGGGATASGNTNTINIGTAGVSGSTANITIGSGTSGGTTTINGTFEAPHNVSLGASGTTVSLGTSTGPQTVNVGTGAVASPNAQTINIGTGQSTGGVKNINIGVGSSSGSNNIKIGTNTGTSGLTNTIDIGGSSETAGSTVNLYGNINLLPANASTNITLGGTSQSGTIYIGRATGSVGQTVEISNNGGTGGQTTRIGTMSGSGSSAYIYIGHANASYASKYIYMGNASSTAYTNSYIYMYGSVTIDDGVAGSTQTIGGTSQTGTITLGRSTASQTIQIGSGALSSGNTRTINIGTSIASGTSNINIGNSTSTLNSNVYLNGDTEHFGGVFTLRSATPSPYASTYYQVASIKARTSVSGWAEAARIATYGSNGSPSRCVIGQDKAAITFFDGFGSRYVYPADADTALSTDATCDLGASFARFKLGRFSSGTTTSSDRNEKRDIEELTAAELRVAARCKPLLRKFRLNEAYETKGDDARIHFGIIAQDLDDAFTAEGLDAHRYAMFMEDTWYDIGDGTAYPTLEDVPEDDRANAVQKTRLGVRYEQLLAFIIAAL